MGKAFDENGDLAKSGQINAALLQNLNQIDFYSQTGAKSLGREWFEKYILHLLPKNNDYVPDLLATASEHITQIIANELNSKKIKNVLVTGGGALNNFLIEGLRAKTKSAVIIPSKKIINFKEALIFAFLGYLRVNETTNVLKSVTGASTDSIAGSVYII
jgi:anhydro-N-acetylmuramic acid kinase